MDHLGYGVGFFDRTFAAIEPKPTVIGVGFELARVPTIYPQWHDIPMDYAVTEKGGQRATNDMYMSAPILPDSMCNRVGEAVHSRNPDTLSRPARYLSRAVDLADRYTVCDVSIPEDIVNISLPPRLETLIRQKVESGFYESFSQVIEEALYLVEERDHVQAMRRERLLQEIAKGIYQADNRHLVDSSEVFRTLRKKPASSEA